MRYTSGVGTGQRRAWGMVVALVAGGTFGGCGSGDDDASTGGQKAPPNVPAWSPLTPAELPATCGALLATAIAPPRASSLRRGSCDFGEIADSVRYDLLCAPGAPCAGQESGDQLCHRLCDDGQCSDGEVCQDRTVYVSDTPSKSAMLCMCKGGACVEKPPAPSAAAGGLDAWREESPMPSDLYYHAAAADDRHLFISGGLKAIERGPNGSATLEKMDVVSVADLDPVTGAVSGFRQAGTLAGPTVHHAMAVLGDRLYVAGGEAREGRAFAADVVSYPINADGTLGALRAEPKLPLPRGYHGLFVDAARRRLIVAGGSSDALYFTQGSRAVVFADVDAAGGGVVGPWASIDAPFGESYSGDVGVAGGTLFFFDTGTYNDRSSRALYGIRLSSVEAGAPASAFVRNTAWPFDPSALSASETVGLAGTCDAFVLVGDHGRVATAPVDGRGHVGAFAAAARFEGNQGGWAIASSPSGRVYVTGGFASSSAEGARVVSTRRAP